METHEANLGGLGYVGDLSEPEAFIERLSVWGIRSADLLVGGVPCQPFSRAGRSKIKSLVAAGERHGDDPRAALWRSFTRVVEALRPKAVLVENVPDLPAWDDGAVLAGFFESFRTLGYAVDARVLDAFRFGVPQHRARLFIVATAGARRFDWPEPDDTQVSLRDAIGDLPIVRPAQRRETVEYYGAPSTDFQRQMRARVPADELALVHDHVTRAVRSDDHEAFRLMGQGQTYEDLPEELRRYRSDIFTDKYKRLSWDELSRSITAHIAKDGYWYIHPNQHRTLSIREAARIQTFPDHFRFAGQPSHRLRQIGNAVPPLLAQALGERLTETVRRRPRPSVIAADDAFRRDLIHWHDDHRRSYPWRDGLEPWHVLMAEMCLHRTRADQVVPVFERLRMVAPTPEAMLANADGALDAMRSLGLRWRAENIIKVARVLVDEFAGRVPEEELLLRSLPGVGDYVAQAVLCFGFGRRAVLLDTNTMRIVSRLDGRPDSRRWQLRLDLYRLAGSQGPDAEFNYALLDLGALVCPAGRPRCESCPVRDRCATGAGTPTVAQMQLEPV